MERDVEGLVLNDQDPDDQGDETVGFSLNVVLQCTSTNSTEERPITFKTTPNDVHEIKKAIEASFDIPSCTQNLKYESVVLKDSDSISSLQLRSDDTLHLAYKAKAECGDIEQAANWMESAHALLCAQKPSNVSDNTRDFIIAGYQQGIMEDLAYKHFSPWISPVTQVNKLYFLQLGGLDVLLRLYTLVLGMPWSETPVEVKYLQCVCMNVLSNLASSLDLRKLLIQRNVVQMSLQSLLQVKLVKGKVIADDTGSEGAKELIDALLQDNISSAVAILANVCELTEVHHQIASNHDALDQMVCLSHSPSTQILWSMLVSTVFLCLANSVTVHKYLTQPDIIESLMDISQLHKVKTAEYLDSILLSYFIQVFLAQLVLQSLHLINPDLLPKMAQYGESFLQMATPTEIMEYEEKRRFSWSVFFPYVELVYLPSTELYEVGNKKNNLQSKLQLMAMDTILFWLHNTLGREIHREILLKEKLLDYVICIPWNVPKMLQHKARMLIALLAPHIPIEPPRLSILAKAKLAKTHFGLKKMMEIQSVNELISQ